MSLLATAGSAGSLPAPLLGELSAFALAVGFSPVHLGLLFLLLLGPRPLQRGGWFVAGWLFTSVLTVTLLVTIGHGLLLGMEKGSVHRTGLDLLGAGALLALGLRELLGRSAAGDQPPSWTTQLERFCAMPLPLLLGLSGVLQVISPEDLFLYAKTAGSLLASDLGRGQEALITLLFSLASSLLLLVPFAAVLLLGSDRVLPLLQRAKTWLFERGELIVAGVSLLLAGYLGWQGIDGLQLPMR
ncbi:GAP family protein [Synechococcus sp. CS-1328]|uniref:GAP family protein n=1 Tax=Synechococcus sp. CS-1328 TaxID=2847976 RepID=UPI00223B371A|nr:GAP family protein [Synechococcus sp. CS-1328]MCT0224186.1 GAP family protein [Synechococcus sp. CS-1328]